MGSAQYACHPHPRVAESTKLDANNRKENKNPLGSRFIGNPGVLAVLATIGTGYPSPT